MPQASDAGTAPMTLESIPPWITLLVVQPSPFCNINCDYCYLPSRSSTKRMPMPVLRQVIERVFNSELVRDDLTLIWHAGEPLALPISWYEEAFTVIESVAPENPPVRHSIQSNGTLINQAWCDFIKRKNISIGLSIDGPAFLHDAHRKTRKGGGTHEAAMRGLRLLKENEIPFHVIAVVTEQALDHPEEIFDFFEKEGVTLLGFNIEEVEAENSESTLHLGDHDARVLLFMETIYRLQKERKTIVIREFAAVLDKIRSGRSMREFDFPYYNEQVRPFGIVSVDCDGNFSTYSPELLGMKVEPYGDFSFGNVAGDEFVDALGTQKFLNVLEDMKTGIRMCQDTCEYYGYCGGGAPANKYYENGSFASTETMYCRYSVKMPLDIVLADIEQSLESAEAVPAASQT